MKKIGIAIAALFLASCSLADFLPTPPEPIPVGTSTIVFGPTSTSVDSVVRTATFTLTPTVLGGQAEPTQTLTPTPGIRTVTPFPSSTGFPSSTPPPTVTPASPGFGFESVYYADSKIYWGICRGNKTRFAVQVTDVRAAHNVVFFVRLKDTKSDDTTDWSNGEAMNPNGDGKFTYTLKANDIAYHESYRRAWVIYQFVIEDVYGEVIGRSHAYTNNITVEPCMCMTPPCD